MRNAWLRVVYYLGFPLFWWWGFTKAYSGEQNGLAPSPPWLMLCPAQVTHGGSMMCTLCTITENTRRVYWMDDH